MRRYLVLILFLLIPLCSFAVEQGYAIFDSATGTLTFKYGVKPAGDNVYDTDCTRFNCYNPPNWNCDQLKKVIFDSSFANARPTSTAHWFAEAFSLSEIVDIKYLNTSEVKSMWNMFGNCWSLTTLDLSHFETSKVEQMREMFAKCFNLKSLDISSFNTSNVKLMGDMFCDCNNLGSLDVSHFDTSNVTDINGMFSNCWSLTKLDVSGFNTSNVTNMRCMFSDCSNLTSLDVSHFDTRKVTEMDFMFAGLNNVTRLDVTHFETSNVTNMEWLFRNCESLKVLDLSNFDTGKVTNISYLFADCTSLETIYVSDKWSTENITSGEGVFSRCDRLFGGKGTSVYVNEQTDYTYARIDGGSDAPGFFTDVADRIVGDQGYAVFEAETGTLTFKYGEMPDGANVFFTDNTHFDIYDAPYWDRLELKKVVFDKSFANARPRSTAFWFAQAGLLTEITGLKYLNTSSVTNMYSMFQACYNLTSLDLSTFNTSHVTNMNRMFWFCGIKEIDLSHFDTSIVDNMDSMFSECQNLTTLNLGTFDTGNVTKMGGMFFGCRNLETIYVSNLWNTSSVTEGDYVFYNCEKLVGGMGSAYICANDDIKYARIDGGENNPGYFTSSAEAPKKKGDVNGDGTVNVTDIVELVNYIMGHPSDKFNEAPADANSDGEINNDDITTIVNNIMGN